MKDIKNWMPVFIGFAVTPICLYLAILSGVAGHGDYHWAIIFFPYTMLSTHLFESITLPFILIAIIQYPAYGILLNRAIKKERFNRIFLLLAVIHILSTTTFFYFPNDFVH